MTDRPVVGVVGYHHVVPRPFGELPVVGAPDAYGDAVRAAGGLPVLLPPEDALALLGIVDAVVLTGGGDVDPRLYGGDAASSTEVDPVRDQVEIAVARAAVTTRTPLLAVCRGLQVLVVAFGGTLRHVEQHVRVEAGHVVHSAPGSLVHRLIGDSSTTTALHQHAVGDPGRHWRATAWADDGVVEAVEPTDSSCPVLGVQWHPELGRAPFADPTGDAMFGWLVSRPSTEVRHGRPLAAGLR